MMRGLSLIILFLLVIQTASAMYTQGEGYEAIASEHSPILFIPGIMGSALDDNNRWTMSDNLWPGNPHEDRMELALKDDGKTVEVEGSDIIAPHVLRTAWGAGIYKGFYTYMDTNTPYKFDGKTDNGDYMGQAYFDHPYDFRRPTAYQLYDGKRSLDDDIKKILEHTKSDKIILVAHSMGGLQSKMYASEHPEKVRAVILLSSPLNGAPRGFQSLTEGYNFGAGKLITESHVWEIGHNWEGVYHLSPDHQFVKSNGNQISLDETFGKGISFQQAGHIPSEAFAELEAQKKIQPEEVTKKLEEKYSGLSPTIWKQTKEFRSKFNALKANPSVRVEIIHGDNQVTTQEFKVRNELYTSFNSYGTGQYILTDQGSEELRAPFQFTIRRLDRVDTNEGDETVHGKGFPWSSASNTQTVNFGHMAMASEPETLDKVMKIVEEINHDKRDKQWLDNLNKMAIHYLARAQSLSEEEATKISQEYADAIKEENKKEEKDTVRIGKLTGDIKGRGKYVFFQKMLLGKKTTIQIIVPEAGEYDNKNKEFYAWIALEDFSLVDSNIGKIQPSTYSVTMDKETFLGVMSGTIDLKQAWDNGSLDVSGGLKENLIIWAGS